MWAYCKKLLLLLLAMLLLQASTETTAADPNPATLHKPTLWHELSPFLPVGMLPLQLTSLHIYPARFPALTAYMRYAGADASFNAYTGFLLWEKTYRTRFSSFRPEWFSLLLPVVDGASLLFAFHPWENRAYEFADTFLTQDIQWIKTEGKECETFAVRASTAIRLSQHIAISAGGGYLFGTEVDTVVYKKFTPVALTYREETLRTKNGLMTESSAVLYGDRLSVAITGFYTLGWSGSTDSLMTVEKTPLGSSDTLLNTSYRWKAKEKQAGGGTTLSYAGSKTAIRLDYYILSLKEGITHDVAISATFSPHKPFHQLALHIRPLYSIAIKGTYTVSWSQLAIWAGALLPLKEKNNHASISIYYQLTTADRWQLSSFGIGLSLHFRGRWFERIKID